MEMNTFYQFQKKKKIKQYVVWVYKEIHSQAIKTITGIINTEFRIIFTS